MISADDVLRHIEPVDPDTISQMGSNFEWELRFYGGMGELDWQVLKRTPGVEIIGTNLVQTEAVDFEIVQIRIDPLALGT